MSVPCRFIRSDRVLARAFAGEALVATVDDEGLQQLSGPAALIWELLEVPRTLPELVAILSELYEIEESEIEPEVNDLLDQFLVGGLADEVLDNEV